LLPSLNERWSREQLCPALDHFVHRPTAGAPLIDVYDQVIVVRDLHGCSECRLGWEH
jgi:hypothetical protein